MRFSALTALLATVVLLSTSCRGPRSFQHYSTVFELSLQGAPKRVPDSQATISLLSVDSVGNRGLFRITHSDSGQSGEEWVVNGDYFRTGFGSQGLRLGALRADMATLQRFGVR